MTKEEKIQESYGDNFKMCNPDANGWTKSYTYSIDFKPDWEYSEFREETEKHHKTAFKMRPKSLQGIENNRGWIKIESKDDLPKIPDFYWCRDNNGAIHQIHYEDITVGYSTHYQPIVKPEPPIY